MEEQSVEVASPASETAVVMDNGRGLSQWNITQLWEGMKL